MDGFDHILNWKLKVGSHMFPGRDGGTCINEAALVAAGFAYKPIHRVDDMPRCFSRPICRLAMRLNDEAGDEERQRLLPFFTKLACADTEEVERERAAYIRSRIKREISFEEGLEALTGALAIGRRADPLEAGDVSARMSATQGRAKRPSSVPEESLASLFTSWAWAKKVKALS